MKKLMLIILLLFVSNTVFANPMKKTKKLDVSLIEDPSDDQGRLTVKAQLTLVRYSEVFLLNYSDVWGTDGETPDWICSDLTISIGKKNLTVPLSVYCDLSEVNEISLGKAGDSYVLLVRGGKTATGYVGKIYFDTFVERREVRLGEFPDQVWQINIYNVNEIDD